MDIFKVIDIYKELLPSKQHGLINYFLIQNDFVGRNNINIISIKKIQYCRV